MNNEDPESMAPLTRTSMAYASANPATSFMNRMNYHFRVNFKAILATTSFALIVLVLSSDSAHHGAASVPVLSNGSW